MYLAFTQVDGNEFTFKGIWVVEGNKVSRREVTVYSPTGEANLLISKGLEPGETVVTAGVYQLTEGEAIKVLM